MNPTHHLADSWQDIPLPRHVMKPCIPYSLLPFLLPFPHMRPPEPIKSFNFFPQPSSLIFFAPCLRLKTPQENS